jgi:hypothetical protein
MFKWACKQVHQPENLDRKSSEPVRRHAPPSIANISSAGWSFDEWLASTIIPPPAVTLREKRPNRTERAGLACVNLYKEERTTTTRVLGKVSLWLSFANWVQSHLHSADRPRL